jgi:hypothetical protein
MRFFLHPFFLFAVLFFLTIIPHSFNPSTYFYFKETTSWPSLMPNTIIKLIVAGVLLLVIIAYWMLSKRIHTIDWKIFIPHLLLTIPTVLFVRFFNTILYHVFIDDTITSREFLVLSTFVVAAYSLFVLGQILFLIYFLKTRSKGQP